MKALNKTIITSNRQIAPGAFLLSFSRTFEFIAGQVIGIATRHDEEPRLYSIASGNTEPLVRILYTVKTEGKLTPGLARLRPGDVIYISGPFGKFLGSEEPAVWVATGTGIAPFSSMFFSGLSANKILIQGNRYASGLYFGETFKKGMGERYFPSCTREKVDGLYHGRILNFLSEKKNLDLDLKYYLCGSAEMVVDVRDMLIGRGVPFEHVLAEIFF